MEHYSNFHALGYLPETGDDLVDDKQIRASVPVNGVIEHQSLFTDSSHDIWGQIQVERWRFVRPLGQGGFGQVHLEEKVFQRFSEYQGSTPQYRAVKIIPEKRGTLRTRKHLPEILGMAKFSKVCWITTPGRLDNY